LTFAAIVVGGYLLGSCPWGYWLPRIFRGDDVRKSGSGSIGGSNVWRTYGPKLAIPVMLLDALKGFVPALVGVLVVSHLCGILAGAAAMLGHARPLYLRFEKGGKMVATGAGVLIAVCPWVAVAAVAIWFALFLLTRYASVASIVASLALPVCAVAFGYPVAVIVFAGLTGAAVTFLHRGNMRRLRAGTESRFRGLRGLRRATPV
jgi:acyl phosphate:glycerol-3-phosphate acyltransferase